MRRIALLPLLILAAMPVAAHDFWIDLSSYRQEPDRPIPVRFLIGDVGAVESWETLWRKIVSLRSYGPGGVDDHQAGIRETDATGPGGATVTIAAEGTHVLAFETHQAENDISAEEFNAYAVHEGRTPALAKRRRDGMTGARGRELYSRRGKAIVQVGTRISDDPIRAIGQTLEIVPERNPYGLAAGEPLRARILYRGRPLAGASVVLERLDATTHGTPRISDAEGRVRFPLEKTGRWRMGVVWTQPITHPRAEYDTVFSSLTFGY